MENEKKYLMEGQRGNLLVATLFLVVLLALVPFIIKLIFPQVDIIYKIVLIFAIYSLVTQMLQNNSTLTLLIPGILVYFMVFKYGDIFTSLWFLSLIFTYLGATILVTTAKDFLGGEGHGGMGYPPR